MRRATRSPVPGAVLSIAGAATYLVLSAEDFGLFTSLAITLAASFIAYTVAVHTIGRK